MKNSDISFVVQFPANQARNLEVSGGPWKILFANMPTNTIQNVGEIYDPKETKYLLIYGKSPSSYWSRKFCY